MIELGSHIGLIREGTIRRYDPSKGTIRIGLNMSKSDSNNPLEYDVKIPSSWTGPNGEFSGGFPPVGATVWCAMAQGGSWSVLSYSNSDGVFGNTNTSSGTSLNNNLMSALRPGRWLTQVNNNIRLFIDPETGIQAGNPNQFIHIDPLNEIYSNTFSEQLSFTEASRKIEGTVKRDLVSNSTRNITGSALTSHIYDESLQEIGLDPLTRTGRSFNRNPAFNESRELVYEFANSFGFTDDDTEIALYDNKNSFPQLDTFFNRRDSRADTLSLSLVSPNQLIEAIKGTVVDVYGNLLDINRSILPSGKDNLSFRLATGNKSDTFTALREQTRKTIAYHFELNARKATLPNDNSIKNPTDYARDRSRLSLDIDKEGQFKVNIPASSEVGNISLLTRYENYSTLKAVDSSGDIDPDQFLRNVDNQDIFNESFGIGVISVNGPTDRVSGQPIKLGTAYHDLQQTLQTHNRGNPIPMYWYPNSIINNQSYVPLVGNIVSPTINISGDNANAGGRSGTINLDGMISLSIGANTIDRQSMWLDCAGGMVWNIGRDLKNRSLMSRFDGDVFIQVGGATVANDSRFGSSNNAVRDGTLDLRVVQGGNMTVVRIDPYGVVVASPGSVDIVAHGQLRLKSIANDIILDARGIYFYADENGNGRFVRRDQKLTI